MTDRTPSPDALAHAVATMIGGIDDVADALANLMADCAQSMSADAVAILARGGGSDRLGMLAATSHRATEIEMLQIQHSAGPCVDCIKDNRTIVGSGTTAIDERWGDVGRAITGAGFANVAAFPMRYRGVALGGLNVFHRESRADDPAMMRLGQATADVATLLVVQAPVSPEQVRARLHEAVSARELVEQAKGVIAYVQDLDLGAAYDELLRRSSESDVPLTQTALDVVSERVRDTDRP